ncbi:hypothetical protein [Hymenobacter chitinivorans]|uniref:Uncharacterized protein n=1 Tax=Hymenobacter chitinivorans DSM 11115 TaxID=1121954 RepID=A0A2M9BNL4_9BACT|nr:hypothetical protein [Hymenobacter chitinivorans]PJJ59532.1 hypothetical protein CLV45_0951 [Hymenobacter chitinivorans DSM 11115]
MPTPSTTSAGIFELRFQTEQSFLQFGQQYARCYANLAVPGQLSAPAETGQQTYSIDFSLDCGCDAVLTEFRQAYDLTFPAPDTAPAAPGPGRDWTGELRLCRVVPATPAAQRPVRDFTSRIPRAPFESSSTTTLVADLAGQPWLDGYALGKGVNAVTGSLSAQALAPFATTPATTTNSATNYSNINSTSAVDQLIDVSASGSYNLDGVTISASASYLSEIKQSELDMTILATYQVEYTDYDTITIAGLHFTPQAQQLIEQGNFTAFRNLYGDYYIAGTKREASFQAVYTISADSEQTLTQVQAALGASAPDMFTAQGEATFKQATSASNVSVNFYLNMQGMPSNAPGRPTAPIGIDTVQEYLTWFQDNNVPEPAQAELIHYSQINPNIPNTLPINPSVFSAVGSLYFNTYLLQITLNSLPDSWQGSYPQQVNALVKQVTANQQTIVNDPATLQSLTSQVNALYNELNNLNQRYIFIQSIAALQASEPSVGSRQSQTLTYGSITYPNAANDPDFVIQSTHQNYAESGHVGHKEHDFNLAPGGVIVQWQLHQVWADGTDGSWWKNSQRNNSNYILLNTSANVHCESAYDRGFDNTLWVWYVDSALLPGPVSNTTQMAAATA